MSPEEIRSIQKAFANYSDDELIKVVTVERLDYLPEAVGIAEFMLQQRGIVGQDESDSTLGQPYGDLRDSDLLKMISGEQPMHVNGADAIRQELIRRGISFESDQDHRSYLSPKSKPLKPDLTPSTRVLAEQPFSDYHTAWRRFWADSIDAILLSILFYIGQWIFLPVGYGIFVLNFVIFVLQFTYRIYFHTKYNGQTIGKRLLKIRVLDFTESRPPTFAESFRRDLVFIVLGIAAYTLIAFSFILNSRNWFFLSAAFLLTIFDLIWTWLRIGSMLLDEKRRGWHDKMANTVVVKV